MEQRTFLKDLQFWTLIAVIFGAIFNYVFVTRISTELANSEKQVKMTLDVASFIKDIQPNLQIDAGGIKYEDKTTLIMHFDISNIGVNAVTIKEPTFWLTSEPISAKDKTTNPTNRLREGTDYQLVNMTIGDVPPGQKVQHIFEIKFTNIAKIPDKIYYYTNFSCQTDWAVNKVALNILGDYLAKEEVQKLTVRDYNRNGPVEVAPKPRSLNIAKSSVRPRVPGT
jgi:hypothetical protein